MAKIYAKNFWFGDCLRPTSTVMQNFTPTGATIAEISVTGRRINTICIYASILCYIHSVWRVLWRLIIVHVHTHCRIKQSAKNMHITKNPQIRFKYTHYKLLGVQCNTIWMTVIVLTVGAALTVFLTEILSHDTPARVVAALAWMITRHVVMYMTWRVLTTNLHLPDNRHNTAVLRSDNCR